MKKREDHTSRFSVIKGGLDGSSKPKIGVTRKPRLTGKQKVEAERKGGGSAYVRHANNFEKRIGKPIKIDGKNWYLYNDGIWKLAGESDRFSPIALDVQGLDDRNPRTSDLILKIVNQRNHLTIGEEFYGCIRNDPLDENCYLINCPSGVMKIDLTSGRLIEIIGHSPSHMFTSSLAVDYDGKAECPKFLEIANQILPHEKDRELLYLFFGYCLFPSCRLETALFCIGSGGNGKSLLTNTIASVFGKDNRLSITLKEICKKDRKQLIRLDKKLVNLSTEVEVDPIKDSATFKMLVSGEDIETDRIYRDALTINPRCKYCLLMNHMPEFGKGSNAEIRRTRIIHFPNEYEGNRRDTKLGEKLASEKAGILALLIDRLKKIATIDSMPLGGDESKSAQEAFGVSNNPVTAFVRKYLELTNNDYNCVSRMKIWTLYNEFASANDLEPMNSTHLMRNLYEYYPKLDAGDLKRDIDGEKRRFIKCVKLKKLPT